jgi:hypothetical protein
VVDPFDAPAHFSSSHRSCRAFIFIIRVVITVFVIAISIIATRTYLDLKKGFEINMWYTSSDEDKTSLSRLLTLTASIPSVISVLKAIIGKELFLDLGYH